MNNVKQLFANKKLVILVAALAIAFLIAFAAFRSATPRPLSVTSTDPRDSQAEVALGQQMVFEFNRELTESEKEEIYLKTLPVFTFNTFWQTPKKLILRPSEHLRSNETYTISIVYKDKLLKDLVFSTISEFDFSTIPPADIILQAEGDLAFAEAERKFLEAYPWYPKFPIETNEYVVVFDTERKEFRIVIKYPEAVSEDIKNRVVNEAIKAIEERNVDLSEYGYYLFHRP